MLGKHDWKWNICVIFTPLWKVGTLLNICLYAGQGVSHNTRLLQIWNVILSSPFALVVFFFFFWIKLHSVLNQEEGGGGKFEFVWPWVVKALRTYLQLNTPEYISLFRAIVMLAEDVLILILWDFINLKDGIINWNTTIYLLGTSLLSWFLFPSSIKVQGLPWGLWNSP